ncbi:PIN domain-containing protein [Streptomyces sp. NPDC002838]|uniref:PIN domain-containing protein n=1 Tax=Streptomyces sp. NPDC002838 TaxID=3154436 RepID=UPI00331E08DF
MIILDTSILRTFSPESSSADLLRAIRAVGAEMVAIPKMVSHEIVAQQAIKYREKYEAAVQALASLQKVTPWPLDLSLDACDPDRVRTTWSDRWRSVVKVIPTSALALEMAVFREANGLAPCKTSKGEKTGSRDAAIWLSAVWYARQNPEETVYFVSANTRDFGDGTSYVSPMREDVARLGDRFVHFTSLDQVMTRFARASTPDEGLAVGVLKSATAVQELVRAARKPWHLPTPFECTAALGPSSEPVTAYASGGEIDSAVMVSTEGLEAYRIGDLEWYTAIVRWHMSGAVNCSLSTTAEDLVLAGAGWSWTARVLFAPDPKDPRLTVLRQDPPRSLTAEEFRALDVSEPGPAHPSQQSREFHRAGVAAGDEQLR